MIGHKHHYQFKYMFVVFVASTLFYSNALSTQHDGNLRADCDLPTQNTTTGNITQSSSENDRIENQLEPPVKKPPKTVCYPGLGCYSSEYPWNNTEHLPSSPETIDAKFYLSSRMTGKNRTLLITRPELQINASSFDPDRWVVFVTHGFFGSAVLNNWIGDMEEALLMRGDVNVIACDWSPGSSTINYAQAAANARVVGAEIARLAQFLLDNDLAARERIHLIGQSLGAHAMSYAAVNLESVAHLTGLDPAQPGFEGAHPDVRIDATDADFVDVIHTDAKPFLPDFGLGLIQPAGDVDFFVNGGGLQPGCFQTIKEHLQHYPSVLSILTAPFQVVGDYFSCNHRRAHQYYIEALKSDCSFWARKWTPSGPLPKLYPCTPEVCQEMGKFTNLFPARGSFYVQTKFPAPYCVWEQESDDNMIEYLAENIDDFFFKNATYSNLKATSNYSSKAELPLLT